jgi:ribosomal protein L37E
MYIIFRCRKCGRYLYEKAGSKTKTCTCGYRNYLRRVITIKKVEDERTAGEVVRFMQSYKNTDFKSLG